MTFHKTIQTVLLAASLSSYVVLAQSDKLQSGTQVTVRTSDSIDAKDSNEGRIYTGVVDQDVKDRSGRVMIPRGSDAELIVRGTSDRNLVLDLESVRVNGRRYSVSTTDENVGSGSTRNRKGVGANSRTGKYVGGGAVIGSIIGAIAGGGKGAAIGAATGAGAGAVTQTVTKGGKVRVPSESLVTFRLDRPLTIVEPDPGYDRDGRHYHRYDNSRSRFNKR
ncbi:MAG: hypothetical protein SGI92_08155 [Bryobacteraceae bacterium]|nr:hypothetical protein [Bryobacteraceae bacterium]